MKKPSIHINCDLGEGLENDERIMPFISSANIACGGHAGNEQTILETIRLARDHEVEIGAHPSYPDQENFGRKVLDIKPLELEQSIKQQLDLFFECADKWCAKVSHVKPHGALYNEATGNPKVAEVITNTFLSLDKKIELFVPYGSIISEMARKKGIKIKYEAFADRNYHDDLSLVSRNKHHAMVSKEAVLEHVLSIMKGHVKTPSGLVSIKTDTFCVHGDNPVALEILDLLNESFHIVK